MIKLIPAFVYLFTLTTWSSTLMLCSKKPVFSSEVTPEYELVWFDEFDKDGPPSRFRWNYEIGDGCDSPAGCGWGNNQKQYYTDVHKNVRVENGNLIIEAHREPKGNSQYTSARLTSKGRGDWKYGRIEIRAKLPSGKGTWPEIWMLPTDNVYGEWPKSGDIGIMEHFGHDQDRIRASADTESFNSMKGTQQGVVQRVRGASTSFNTYAIDWFDDRIEWHVNGAKFNTFPIQGNTDKWPFDQKFHLILNLAIGGNRAEEKGIDNDIFPQRLVVDYVRVYELQ